MNAPQPIFSESESASAVLNGAIFAVDAVFQTDAPLSVKRALFDTACWLVSERYGKYKTRYRSEGSLVASKNELRHEHIIPRAQLWFVARRTMSVSDALRACEACVVTKEEHSRLHAVEEAYGWERYAKAGIMVIDSSSGDPVPRSRLIKMSAPFKKAFREARFVGDGQEELEAIKNNE